MLKPCKRKEPVTKEKWDSFFDCHGYVTDDMQAELRKSVFHGGVSPEIRREVWIYLLGHRAPSTAAAKDFEADRKERYVHVAVRYGNKIIYVLRGTVFALPLSSLSLPCAPVLYRCCLPPGVC